MTSLAHYGGIDEIGVFVVPAVAVILLLRWAERRAREREDHDDADETETPPGDSMEVDHPTTDR